MAGTSSPNSKSPTIVPQILVDTGRQIVTYQSQIALFEELSSVSTRSREEGEMLPNDDEAVAVGFFTEPEFKRWGRRLEYVYPIEENDQFKDLLDAIDKADRGCRNGDLCKG